VRGSGPNLFTIINDLALTIDGGLDADAAEDEAAEQRYPVGPIDWCGVSIKAPSAVRIGVHHDARIRNWRPPSRSSSETDFLAPQPQAGQRARSAIRDLGTAGHRIRARGNRDRGRDTFGPRHHADVRSMVSTTGGYPFRIRISLSAPCKMPSRP
jgi:hypothetical protein